MFIFWLSLFGVSAYFLFPNRATPPNNLMYVSASNNHTWFNMAVPNYSGRQSDKVLTFATGLDGMIYLGGDFTNFSGINTADGIVGYNPFTEEYFALGDGAQGVEIVYSLAVLPDGGLVAGGSFRSMGNIPDTSYVALWAKDEWHSMGGGFDHGVYDMDVAPNGRLYATGGFFYSPSGGEMPGVAYWEGDRWHNVGIGIDGIGRAIEVTANGTIYVGGSVANPPGNITRFNGYAWQPIGNGLDDVVFDLLELNGRIYAAGLFTHDLKGNNVNRVAELGNDGLWHTLGEGVTLGGATNASGRSLTTDGESIFLAGRFGEADGIPVNGVARWSFDTNHWETTTPPFPVYGTMAQSVYFNDGLLYVGFNAYGETAVQTYFPIMFNEGTTQDE